VENETRFSRKFHCESRESHKSRKKGKNAIYCEACEYRSLQDTQTSKIIIYSKKLDPKFFQDSRKTPELKLVLILVSLATKFLFTRLVSSESRYTIFSARLARIKSCYEIYL
jgi:hypothetical protein